MSAPVGVVTVPGSLDYRDAQRAAPQPRYPRGPPRPAAGRAAMSARVGVVTFPGSLDDRDAQRAVRLAGGEPVALWHGDATLHGVDAVILPGGFSYGDYLRAGAIASLSPIMREVIDAANRSEERRVGTECRSRWSPYH